jgi:hypothetical protein
VQGEGGGDEGEHRVFHLSLKEDYWILAAQLKDEACKRLHTVLIREPTDSEGKRIHEEYTLKQNRVYKMTPGGLRWVVPKTARTQVVFYHHDVGHFGAEKTLDLVRQKYWFPRMEKYIKRCVLLFGLYVQQKAYRKAAWVPTSDS